MPVIPASHANIRSLFPLLLAMLIFACKGREDKPLVTDHRGLAAQYFGNDSAWYLEHIPFFECSDQQLQDVYYYRWKMYKAHIREVGADQQVITEFINHVSWDREPYGTINAASMHHIYEGRWMRNSAVTQHYIDYLNRQGGNTRRYSESIADATYANFLVDRDSAFLVTQLDSLIHYYQSWNDHFDTTKQLYFIPVMNDATEYTIASIDASNGEGGFDGGETFRPSINSYMFGNARAIAAIARLAGRLDLETEYLGKARLLRVNVLRDLWNNRFKHFTDRYAITNPYVKYWDFIRGRELNGMAPWYFELPSDDSDYGAAWQHVLDTTQLLGAHGLRTNEPSYEYYFKQIIWFEGQRGSQWNGPSWPFQTSIVLTGMANLLNDYKKHAVTSSDYLHLLRLFAGQHYLPDGKLNLVENYDPNLGGPIVYYNWSNHYNHSSFNNLLITGLCGLRPSAPDDLRINPLIDSSIRYFRLIDLPYHGHRLSFQYDRDGTKYGLGKGIRVWVDDEPLGGYENETGFHAKLPIVIHPVSMARNPIDDIDNLPNLALNIRGTGFPKLSASCNSASDSLNQLVDGRSWFFPEISNRWTTWGANERENAVTVTMEKPVLVHEIALAVMVDTVRYGPLSSVQIDYDSAGSWVPVLPVRSQPMRFPDNSTTTVPFRPVTTNRLRIRIPTSARPVALSELIVR